MSTQSSVEDIFNTLKAAAYANEGLPNLHIDKAKLALYNAVSSMESLKRKNLNNAVLPATQRKIHAQNVKIDEVLAELRSLFGVGEGDKEI